MFLFLVEYKFRRKNVHINAISPNTQHSHDRWLVVHASIAELFLTLNSQIHFVLESYTHKHNKCSLPKSTLLSLSLSLFLRNFVDFVFIFYDYQCLQCLALSYSLSLSVSLPLPHTYALHLRITFVDFGALFAGFTISIKAAQCVLWPDWHLSFCNQS